MQKIKSTKTNRNVKSKILKIANRILKFIIIGISGKEQYARSIGVKIGSGCRILIDEFGTEPFLIEIGNRVTIASGVRLLTHDGSSCLISDERGRRQKYGRIVIGDDVFIGVNSVILPGITVGSRCVIGAGSIVTKSIPDGIIVAGNPAKFIQTFDEFISYGITSFPADGDFDCKLTFAERVCLMEKSTTIRRGRIKCNSKVA